MKPKKAVRVPEFCTQDSSFSDLQTWACLRVKRGMIQQVNPEADLLVYKLQPLT